MKTNGKVKNDLIGKKIDELCEAFNKDDRFLVFRNRENVVNIALPSNKGGIKDSDVSASLAIVIERYLLGDDDEGVKRLSEIVIKSIEAIVGVSHAGGKLASRLARAAILGMEYSIDRLKELNEDIEEDCDGCEYMRTCDNENAIKYRKANGIPRPKKNKKGERKVDVN